MNGSAVTISSFFAGIGGFDLAFERRGFSTVFQCEIDGFCSAVLERHWPSVERARDVREIESTDVPESVVWCAGFPCQDVSLARGAKGRAGLKGKNSGLFFPFLRHIRIRKPRIILLENVVGLLSSHNGQDFRIILESLTDIGYAVSWRIMNSRYYGSPQSRPRVFICAALNDAALPVEALYERTLGVRPRFPRAGFLEVDSCDVSGAMVPRVAYCLAATSGRHTGTDWSRTYVSYEKSVRRLTPGECEGLQGFPNGWTDVPDSCGRDRTDCDTPRYHALGNAVSVPVVEWIAGNLRGALDRSTPVDGPASMAVAPFRDFADSSVRAMRLSELHYSTQVNGDILRWQTGGYARGDDCIDMRAPEAPSEVVETPLIDVVEKKRPSTHYYLSANAAEGILRRVDGQGRTLFGPMDHALRRMVRSANPESRFAQVPTIWSA